MSQKRAKAKRRELAVPREKVIDFLLEKLIKERGGAGQYPMSDLKAELLKAIETAVRKNG